MVIPIKSRHRQNHSWRPLLFREKAKRCLKCGSVIFLLTLNRTSPRAPERQRTAFNGKWQPTEGCRLRLLSKGWNNWFCCVTGVFGAFHALKSTDRKKKGRIHDNGLRVSCTIKKHQGGPTPPLHSYVNRAISKCYKHPQRTIRAGQPRPYIRTLTTLYPMRNKVQYRTMKIGYTTMG